MTRPILALALLASFASPAPAQDDVSPYEAAARRAFELFAPVGLAVAVVADGEVVLEAGFGLRDATRDEPVTPRSLFNIASCTKAFTSACTCLLVERGALAWDDPAVAYVPEFALSDPWITYHLTVRDLLCHRSGLETFAGDILWYGARHDDAEILARTTLLPITRRFREQFGYQNILFMVAGQVVERVDGRPWSEFVRDELFAPLGMAATVPSFGALPDGAEIAWPHIEGERIEVYDQRSLLPAGAIWSSVHDLSAWVRMLLAGGEWQGERVLDSATIHECWKPHTILGGGDTPESVDDFRSYGLGWALSIHDGKKLVQHSGGMPGYISRITLLPADRFGIVVLNNDTNGFVHNAVRDAALAVHRGEDGFAVLEKAAERAREREAAVAAREESRIAARHPDTSPSLPLSDYAGRYEDPLLGSAEVRFDDEGLHLEIVDNAPTLGGDLVHWHHDTFRCDFPDRFLPFALVTFWLDSGGRVGGFTIDCPTPDFDFGSLDFRRDG